MADIARFWKSPHVPINAGTITVSETLSILDAKHAEFAEGVGDGRYMFWLGSGISRAVAPGLDGVVESVIDHLQSRMTPGDADDRFRRALHEIVFEVASLSADEQARTDIDEPIADWPDRKAIVERLTRNYAMMLNVDVDGEESDYLLWEGVQPAATYGGALDPDVEHICLAILGLERTVTVMASANWDGLVEAAMARVTADPQNHLGVVVLAEDLRDGSAPTVLLKFHGCAVGAASGNTAYRKALVGRQVQITGWPDGAQQPVRTRMLSDATSRPTFMIGFSAQDGNIQAVFNDVRGQLAWTWPGERPALTFAEDRLGQWQKNLLKVTYGDAVYGAHRLEIQDASLIRAYGKPLLTALVLDVLTRKAHALIRSLDGLTGADALCDGVTALRDAVAGTAGTGTEDFIRAFLAGTARARSLFVGGGEPASLEHYDRFTMEPAHRLTETPALDFDGVRELAVLLALLGRGRAIAGWTLDVQPTSAGTNGALRLIEAGGAERAVFLAGSGTAAVELERRGPAGAPDAIVIRCDDQPVEASTRSPGATLGRTGSIDPAQVAIRRLLRDATDLDALHRQFCLQAGLAA